MIPAITIIETMHIIVENVQSLVKSYTIYCIAHGITQNPIIQINKYFSPITTTVF